MVQWMDDVVTQDDCEVSLCEGDVVTVWVMCRNLSVMLCLRYVSLSLSFLQLLLLRFLFSRVGGLRCLSLV